MSRKIANVTRRVGKGVTKGSRKTTTKNPTQKSHPKRNAHSRPRSGRKAPETQLASQAINGQFGLYPNTDAGNAELMAAMCRDTLRYDHSRQKWFLWKGHWWTEDTVGHVYQLAKTVVRQRSQAASTSKEFTAARKNEARQRIEAVIKLAQAEQPLAQPGDHWDRDPYLMGVGNGIVDLRTGQLRPGRQSDNVTLHTNVLFDPQAKAPRWEQFISEVFNKRDDLIGFVQRAVGYCLTGDVGEQCFFLCLGAGANGKSTLLDVLRHVLGSYAHNLPFSALDLKKHYSIPNDIAALVGRRFVSSAETNRSAELNSGLIKLLTGSDSITARFLYGEYFTFNPTAKFWLAFNHMPRTNDDSRGFLRRVRVIPFDQCFEQGACDRNLASKLKSEAPGILLWAIEGCLEWQRVGLGTAVDVAQSTEKYKSENDPLEEFLEECCVIQPGARVSAAALWQEYEHWTGKNAKEPIPRAAFTHNLEQRGFKKGRFGHDRSWTWFDLCLKRLNPEPLLDASGTLRTDADVEYQYVPVSSEKKPN